MSEPSLSGKTVVVTGANTGIGKETARALARMGARTVLVCRNEARGREARDEIVRTTKNDAVELALCDFASQRSIRDFCERFRKEHDRLDVLVNNAGLMLPKRETTPDGLEATFAINHLGYFLTTNLLLDVIKASAPSRIVIVASEAHRGNVLDFDDLQSEKAYSTFTVYGRSKLCNLYFGYELADRLAGTGVTANCVHPGVVGSEFGQDQPGIVRFAIRLARPFLLSPEKGAATSIHLASSPDVEGETGKYFVRKKAVRSSKASYDVPARKKLWEISERLVGLALSRRSPVPCGSSPRRGRRAFSRARLDAAWKSPSTSSRTTSSIWCIAC